MTRQRSQGAPDEQFTRPDDWGKDELSEFLDVAQRNTYYCFRANRAACKRLTRALGLYGEGLIAYTDTRKKFGIDERYHPTDCAMAFLMSCDAALHAATTLVFSGQIPEATKQLRGAIEAAFYGYHVYQDPDAWYRWAERPQVDALRRERPGGSARRDRSSVGREFSVVSIASDFPKTANRLRIRVVELYEELIDQGGHLNLPALQARAHLELDDDAMRFHFSLIGASLEETREGLRLATVTAVLCLRVFDLIFATAWARKISSEIATLDSWLRSV